MKLLGDLDVKGDIVGYDLDQVQRNISLATFRDATTTPVFMENSWVDNFGDQTMVDDAASTGESYDASGYYTNAESESVEQSTVGNNVYNGNGGANYTIVDKTFKVNNGSIVKKIGINDVAGASVRLVLGQRVSGSVFNVVVVKDVTTNTSGWQDFTLDTPYEVPESGDYYVGAFSSSNIYYPSDGTSARITFAYQVALGSNGIGGEDTAGYIHPMRVTYSSLSSTMTIITEAVTASANNPTSAEIICYYENIVAVTPGTDLVASFSMDDGAHWESLTTVEDIITGDVYKVVAFTKEGLMAYDNKLVCAKVDVTDSKAIKLHGIGVRWGY